MSDPEDLAEMISGQSPAPPGLALLYREVRWSNRSPISYEVTDLFGRPLARVQPAGTSLTTSLVLVGERPALAWRTDRSGGTTVGRIGQRPALVWESDGGGGRRVGHVPGATLGETVGVLVPRQRLRQQLLLSAGGRVLAVVEQEWKRRDTARVLLPDGRLLASVWRMTGRRVAGAYLSRLDLTDAVTALPAEVSGPLLFAAVPALDAARRAWRRKRE